MSRKLSALVIGNADYVNAGTLRNPAHDAEDIGEKLTTSGFAVTSIIDASHKDMDRALQTFKKELKDQDVGLFFFAGHGVQIEGDNYLAATDTEISDEIEAKHSALSLNRVIETMEKAGTSTNIIILDACRDNPWDRAWRRPVARGLAPVYAPKGTLIAFSTSPGQVAADGRNRNGAYTAALLQHIDSPDCSIETMFKRVRNTLAATTAARQISWEHTSLSGEFYFNLSVGARITDYGATAISDKLFVLDENKGSHRIIKGLKIPTWDRQNAALREFTPTRANKVAVDSLFVLGRNIYQAACGSANLANLYIDEFMDKTLGMAEEKRKALLDGMLFEVFFGPDGKLRDNLKTGKFNGLFHLRQYDSLKPSFDFIAECLLPYANRYYTIPGKPHDVSIDITVDPTADNRVTAVFVGGRDVLRSEDDVDAPARWSHTYSKTKLKEELSVQMLVPWDLLTVTYDPPIKSRDQVEFPGGYTIRRPG
jgi:hypothetical protein